MSFEQCYGVKDPQIENVEDELEAEDELEKIIETHLEYEEHRKGELKKFYEKFMRLEESYETSTIGKKE